VLLSAIGIVVGGCEVWTIDAFGMFDKIDENQGMLRTAYKFIKVHNISPFPSIYNVLFI